MTTEELNAIIAKAEGGDVAAMNELTHIYGEVVQYINQEQAAKWFLELIKRDCNPKSDVYEKTGYDSTLYMQVKNAILNSNTEEDMTSAMSNGNSGSLLGGAMFFTTSRAKTYIDQSDKTIEQHVIYKEEQRRNAAEEAARKKAEEEARQRAEEEARKKEEERRKKEAEAKRKAEEAERARKKAEEERVRKAAADREAAKKVIDKIAYIGDVEYTEDCKIYITSARTAYDSLTVDQKELVNNFNILIAAEKEFHKLKKEEDARRKAEEAERARKKAEEERARIEAAERKVAQKAIDKISNIGKVEYSVACQILIRKAEEAYAALTENQKVYVENYNELLAAQKKFEELKKDYEKEALRKVEEREQRLKEAEEEAKARKKADEEAKKISKFKETESFLQKYCIENDKSILIQWSRLECPSHYTDILEYLKSLNDEQFTFVSNGIKYVVRAYPYGEIKVTKYYQDTSLQQQAEEQIRLRIIRRQIETDWPSSSVFKDEVGSFTIPEGTTRIGNHAFAKCAKLREISIPESVVSIGEQAFERCERLETVQLPNGVTNIGTRAFYCCRELKTIFLGNSLTKIEYGAFEYCVNLISIVLPNSVTSIGNSAFWLCSNLKSITLSPNMTYIGDRAFEGCGNLKEIVVPKGKKDEYLSLLKYSHADGVNIIEKTYSKERSQSRANNTSEKGGILSSLWKALTGN